MLQAAVASRADVFVVTVDDTRAASFADFSLVEVRDGKVKN